MKKINKYIFNRLTILILLLTASLFYIKRLRKNKLDLEKRIKKFYRYFQLVNRWLYLKNSNINIERFFLDNNYKKIAIYGMGELGSRLYEELKNTNIAIKFGIDKYSGSLNTGLDVLSINDKWEDVDVIVITPFLEYEEIEKQLKTKTKLDIISIEDIIYDIY